MDVRSSEHQLSHQAMVRGAAAYTPRFCLSSDGGSEAVHVQETKRQ